MAAGAGRHTGESIAHHAIILRAQARRKPRTPRHDRPAADAKKVAGTEPGHFYGERPSSALDEAGEGATMGALRQLLQRLGLDLANALARHLILAADFLERVLAGLADAEAQPQDVRLAWRESRQRVVGGGTQLRLRRRLMRRDLGVIGDEVADGRVAILAQGRVEA